MPAKPLPIDCPVRRRRISSLQCHTCKNHIRVQFLGEDPPERQCAMWDWRVPWGETGSEGFSAG